MSADYCTCSVCDVMNAANGSISNALFTVDWFVCFPLPLRPHLYRLLGRAQDIPHSGRHRFIIDATMRSMCLIETPHSFTMLAPIDTPDTCDGGDVPLFRPLVHCKHSQHIDQFRFDFVHLHGSSRANSSVRRPCTLYSFQSYFQRYV